MKPRVSHVIALMEKRDIADAEWTAHMCQQQYPLALVMIRSSIVSWLALGLEMKGHALAVPATKLDNGLCPCHALDFKQHYTLARVVQHESQ